VLRLADRLDRTPARIAALAGFVDGSTSQDRPGHPTSNLATAKAFAVLTRLTVDEVHSMCLSSLAG
jgi:hypothetical protein